MFDKTQSLLDSLQGPDHPRNPATGSCPIAFIAAGPHDFHLDVGTLRTILRPSSSQSRCVPCLLVAACRWMLRCSAGGPSFTPLGELVGIHAWQVALRFTNGQVSMFKYSVVTAFDLLCHVACIYSTCI